VSSCASLDTVAPVLSCSPFHDLVVWQQRFAAARESSGRARYVRACSLPPSLPRSLPPSLPPSLPSPPPWATLSPAGCVQKACRWPTEVRGACRHHGQQLGNSPACALSQPCTAMYVVTCAVLYPPCPLPVLHNGLLMPILCVCLSAAVVVLIGTNAVSAKEMYVLDFGCDDDMDAKQWRVPETASVGCCVRCRAPRYMSAVLTGHWRCDCDCSGWRRWCGSSCEAC
jgi:hypothetical protein